VGQVGPLVNETVERMNKITAQLQQLQEARRKARDPNA
jgi:hypothetical protein